MVYENLATILYGGALVWALVTVVFTVKNRDFERGEVENTVNALLFGFFIMMIILLIRFLESLNTWKPELLLSLTAEAATYLGYLTQIEILALAPLLAVCCLVAMFLAKDILGK
ncbi:hypothetical protein HYS50_02180 [Candidatus Woesearchaeota archaeon]|nr:hypothetical protein [Candidatus Woesearchaeota archaeon]